MELRRNKVKDILASGGVVYSSAVRLPEPGMCELLGYAGFDFVMLDGEHGAMSPAAIDRLVQGCFAANTTPVHRVVSSDDYPGMMRALDLGVQGILMPHCRSAADARAFLQATSYPPEGNRGFGPGRANLWGRVSSQDYFKAANDSIVRLALIEDLDGVDNVDEIATTGLDILWVGTGDLALAFGVPGERDHPKVKEAAEQILSACKRHNVTAGYPARSADEAEWAKEAGFRAIGFGCAELYIMNHARAYLQAVGR